MADKLIGTHLLVKTAIADEAITANRFVKLVTPITGLAHIVTAGAGDAACGVAPFGYDSGDIADVVKIGEAWVTANENIAAGALVAADTAGKAKNAVSTNHVLGQAQQDANSGDAVLVLLHYAGIKA